MWTSLFLTALGLGIIGLFDSVPAMVAGLVIVLSGFAVMALSMGEVE